jgi:hypothetical protein
MAHRAYMVIAVLSSSAVFIFGGCDTVKFSSRASSFKTGGILLHGDPPEPLSEVRVKLVDLREPYFSFAPSGPRMFPGSEVSTDGGGRFTITTPNSVRLRQAKKRKSLGLEITSSAGYWGPSLMELQAKGNPIYHVDFDPGIKQPWTVQP